MADIFFDSIDALIRRNPVIQGVAFTDLDGEDIALTPRSERDALRVCAAYGGIALRRLSQAESEAGGTGVDRITVDGSEGRFVTLRVGTEYQLVLTISGQTPVARVLADAQQTVEVLRAAI
jgi:predicted regulator of Ras-like GTPase activity (Roadblock/LC7/MglB family)